MRPPPFPVHVSNPHLGGLLHSSHLHRSLISSSSITHLIFNAHQDNHRSLISSSSLAKTTVTTFYSLHLARFHDCGYQEAINSSNSPDDGANPLIVSPLGFSGFRYHTPPSLLPHKCIRSKQGRIKIQVSIGFPAWNKTFVSNLDFRQPFSFFCLYVTKEIKAICNWAYKVAANGSVIEVEAMSIWTTKKSS
ncbi:hypothetical protein QVD17_06937 [Tagetes erecta]|uniref:Uncharacterized protein n=1 Tax=Tagetes erecta TaxID=13708 RepID=A0AAD8LHV5_TARER|nr:hypothetical protein QVD17_06937 [Tagetes erecta]